jgi:hypothetical protein
MTDPQDNFDLQLRSHFAKELDGQLGRAPAAFARSSRRRPWRVIGWVSGLAAAAAIAGIFIIPAVIKHLGSRDVIAIPTTQKTPLVTPVEYTSAWNTTDEGTVYLEEQPLRSIRRERVDTLRWIDPETNATIEMTIPLDEQVYLALDAH